MTVAKANEIALNVTSFSFLFGSGAQARTRTGIVNRIDVSVISPILRTCLAPDFREGSGLGGASSIGPGQPF